MPRVAARHEHGVNARQLAKHCVPFHERRGVIPNEGGRVIDPESGEQFAGHYAVGWIKRGPSGVIGTSDTSNSAPREISLA